MARVNRKRSIRGGATATPEVPAQDASVPTQEASVQTEAVTAPVVPAQEALHTEAEAVPTQVSPVLEDKPEVAPSTGGTRRRRRSMKTKRVVKVKKVKNSKVRRSGKKMNKKK